MSDWGRGERIAIKESGRSQKRYGSTSTYVKKDFYVEHPVAKTDTLQGLALKYNTSTEQIRRANRLYASDSLFLRDVLKIPVSKEVAETVNNNGGHSSSGSTSDSASASGTFNSSISTESYSDDDEKFASDFLGRIDSAIESTRAQVTHVQQNSHFVDAQDATMVKRRQKPRAPQQQHTGSVTDLPQPAFLNHDRQVRNSLQRYQQQQDALFEL